MRYVMALRGLQRDEKGVTALEYGLIAALIAAVIIGAVTTLDTNLATRFNTISADFIGIGK